MLGLGPTEMIVLLVIVLILFGGSRLPGLMKGMGEGIRNFKQGMNEDPDDKKPELQPISSTDLPDNSF